MLDLKSQPQYLCFVILLLRSHEYVLSMGLMVLGLPAILVVLENKRKGRHRVSQEQMGGERGENSPSLLPH